MKFNFRIAAALVWVCLISSCVSRLDVKVTGDRPVAVHCILSEGTVQYAGLQFAEDLDEEGSFEDVPDAEVSVMSTDGLETYDFRKVSDGLWSADFTPRQGKEYELSVQVAGYDPITAKTTFPRDFDMETRFYVSPSWIDFNWIAESFTYIHRTGEEDITITNWVHSDLPLGVPACYGVSLTPGAHTLLADIKSGKATSMHHSMPGMSFKLKVEEDCAVWIYGENVNRIGSNHLGLDRFNVTEEVFRAEDWYSDSESLDSLDITAARIYDGGALHDGILRLECTANYDNGLKDVYKMMDEDYPGEAYPPTEFQPVRVEDAASCFAVFGDFAYNFWGGSGSDGPALYFIRVSDEYDLYLKDVLRSNNEKTTDFLKILYSHSNNSYTNIHGGFGVFGAQIVKRHGCDLRFNGYSYDIYNPESFILPQP